MGEDLGDRMKRYEGIPALHLIPKMPVLIRLDGRAFHTLTRGCVKPWDENFQQAMWHTAAYLCDEIAGCKVAYVQSDEITLLLIDYERLETQGWFNYDVQKITSVSAGMASARFTEVYKQRGAFDSRAWNLPQSEVVNCFIWRQRDAERNSILGLAKAHFSHRELQSKNTAALQDMLHEKGVNWNDCPTPQKRGVCLTREMYEIDVPGSPGEKAQRHVWMPNHNTPIFSQAREYIDRFVQV